jgi:hypothetical protein
MLNRKLAERENLGRIAICRVYPHHLGLPSPPYFPPSHGRHSSSLVSRRQEAQGRSHRLQYGLARDVSSCCLRRCLARSGRRRRRVVRGGLIDGRGFGGVSVGGGRRRGSGRWRASSGRSSIVFGSRAGLRRVKDVGRRKRMA